jgi:hypothetical protein
MEAPRFDIDHGAPVIQQVLIEKRRRLGAALQHLATELARERRRCAELEREIARLRDAAARQRERPG